MTRERENEITHSDLSIITDHIRNIHHQSKCTKWILKNIKKSNFFDILSLEYTEYLLRELIIFRKQDFYIRLKKANLCWKEYIEECRQVKNIHKNKKEKKWYDDIDLELFIVPYNFVRRPYYIIHDGYCVHEKQRLVTTCSFTWYSDQPMTSRKMRYQNTCFYCTCRYTKSHNTSVEHIEKYTQFFSILYDIRPLPLEIWQYIVHFLYE